MITRTTDELRRYDLFKLIVLLILIALLICLLLGLPQVLFGVAAAPTPTRIAGVEPSPTSAPRLPPSPTAAGITLEAPSVTSPQAGAALTDGNVRLTGAGAPGARVQILVNGQMAGETVVGPDGNWSLNVDLGRPGDYQISARAVEANGNSGPASNPIAVSLAAPTPTIKSTNTPIPASPTATAPTATLTPQPTPTSASTSIPSGLNCVGAHGVDQGQFWIVGDCDTLSHISRRTGIPLDTLIKANPQLQDPDLIFPGQRISLPR